MVRAAYRYGMRIGHASIDRTATVELPRVPDAEPATYDHA